MSVCQLFYCNDTPKLWTIVFMNLILIKILDIDYYTFIFEQTIFIFYNDTNNELLYFLMTLTNSILMCKNLLKDIIESEKLSLKSCNIFIYSIEI